MKNFNRNIITSLALCFALTNTDAQFVTIPDANFRTWLNTHGFASCMNGNQMDTTCSAVVNATSLNCPGASCANLTGIRYFDNVTYLNCESNQIASLPVLPPQLTRLDCGYNQLTSLPVLPSSLNYLFCQNNQLSSLPALPTSLAYIECTHNQLSALPSLPSTLYNLTCGYNQLTTLPSLPSSLQALTLYFNQINSLPVLPGSLTYLDCGQNPLNALPSLPNSLITLFCYNDQLSGLPSLPGSLKNLFCWYNQLTLLPTLPAGLLKLSCEHNQLTVLPNLPSSLVELICNYNQLSSLPVLRDTLTYLYVDNNPNLNCIPSIHKINFFQWGSTGITCLPNIITVGNATPTIAGVPICTAPTAAITASGSTTINAGDSVTLNANVGAGLTYQWKLNTVNIVGATLSSYKAKTAGNYTCVVSNSCNNTTSNTITVTVVSNYVTIPDANFVAWLNANGYASCMNGNQMDTTCTAVVNATILNCYNAGIHNLYGITFFDNLVELNCTSNFLTNLPALPATMQRLYCALNQLGSLPALPIGMKIIYCHYNQLTSLPVLPVGMIQLNCYNNQLSTLPVLPSTLKGLLCNNNLLTQLPSLPYSLQSLDCSSNQLTVLPSLPSGIQILYCDSNQLSTLPLLQSFLYYLTCSANQLTSIPTLPLQLFKLNCAGNNLTSLPSLPDTLYDLLVNDNPGLSCLPPIKRIDNFKWNNTAITCLPNIISVVTATPTIAGVAICTVPTGPTSISVSGGAAKVCPGDTRTYITPLVAGVTYNWTVPAGAVINSGQGTRTINVTYNSGFTSNGTLSVSKVQGCGVSSPKTLAVNRNVPSTPSAISGTTYGLCGAINKVYSITQVAGMTYQWTVPAVASIINGQGTNSINVNFPFANFTGVVSLQAVNACGAGAARNFTVRAIPSTPLSITGPITACANQQNVAYSTAAVASATSYTWGVPKGALITSGQGTTAIVMKYGTESGTVKVRAGNGCGAGGYRNLSIVFNCKEGNSLETDNYPSLKEINIYPNPSQNVFTINISNSNQSNYSLIVRDVTGRVIYEQSTILTDEPFDFGAELSSGMYFAEIKQGDERRIIRLIKSN